MNEEVKKSLRTQRKYSEKGYRKEKRQKESPEEREPPSKKNSEKRNSHGHCESNTSHDDTSENESPVKYQENSNYSFSELQEDGKYREICTQGEHILSETEHGKSTILYEPDFLTETEAEGFLHELHNTTNWNEKNIVIRGVEYPQPRVVAWYGPFPYSYSGVVLEPAEMPELVLEIKRKIERYLRKKNISVTFNSVLLNCYRDGRDSVAWHSDDELTMGISPTIASVSLGEVRKFEMREKYFDEEDQRNYCYVNLTHGSLLIMNGSMQDDWQHRVPKEYHDKRMRINLTFRTVYSLDKSPSSFLIFRSPSQVANQDSRMKKPAQNNSLKNSEKFTNILDDNDFPPLPDSTVSVSPNVQNITIESQESNASFRTDEELNEPESLEENSDNANEAACVNNLNYDGQNIKHDMPNVNVRSCDSSYNNGEFLMADDGNESYGSSCYTTDEHMDDSTDSPLNSSRKNMLNLTETPCTKSKQKLNVNAAVFIPINNTPVKIDENYNFNSCPLEDLVNMTVNDFESVTLLKYTSVLISKIKNLDSLHQYEAEEFDFLFAISDGTQSEKNQKLISDRMCSLIQTHFERAKHFENHKYISPRFERSYHENNPQSRGYQGRVKIYNSRSGIESGPKTQDYQCDNRYGTKFWNENKPKSHDYQDNKNVKRYTSSHSNGRGSKSHIYQDKSSSWSDFRQYNESGAKSNDNQDSDNFNTWNEKGSKSHDDYQHNKNSGRQNFKHSNEKSRARQHDDQNDNNYSKYDFSKSYESKRRPQEYKKSDKGGHY